MVKMVKTRKGEMTSVLRPQAKNATQSESENVPSSVVRTYSTRKVTMARFRSHVEWRIGRFYLFQGAVRGSEGQEQFFSP